MAPFTLIGRKTGRQINFSPRSVSSQLLRPIIDFYATRYSRPKHLEPDTAFKTIQEIDGLKSIG